jgi:uncharacterized membrane protein
MQNVQSARPMRLNRQSPRFAWWPVAVLIALSIVPTLAGGARLTELVSDAEVTASNARFFASPTPVVLHIVSVTIYGLLGALQFSDALRRRNVQLHRASGWLLLPSGMVAALSGLWMTLFYPWPPGDGVALYVTRLIVGVAMAASLVLAVVAIYKRDFRAHGDWMRRAYGIGLGAGTQVLTHLPWFVLIGQPGEQPRAFLMAAGWVINIVIVEWVIARRWGRLTT